MEQCCLCQIAIQNGDGVTEFPCHHKCHSACFFRRAVEDGFAVTCDTCDTLIVSQEVFNEIIGGRLNNNGDEIDKKEVDELKDKLTKDKDFKKDSKLFKGHVREYRSAKASFKRKMTESKLKFQQEIDSFVHMIKDIRKRYIDDAKVCPEYKRFTLAQRRSSYYLTRLSRKWNVYKRNFYKTLVKQNDYWYFSRYYNSPIYLTRRAFRIRGLLY